MIPRLIAALVFIPVFVMAHSGPHDSGTGAVTHFLFAPGHGGGYLTMGLVGLALITAAWFKTRTTNR